MKKQIQLTIFLSLASLSLPAQEIAWRWTAQSQAFYQGLTASYAIYLDGVTSSTEVISKAGTFYGIHGGLERTNKERWTVGILLGYQQQGLVEDHDIFNIDGSSGSDRRRWINHQLAFPSYVMRHFGKRRGIYARLSVIPAFSLGESDESIGSLNAPAVVLNADLELGADISVGEASLRPGLLIGGSPTPATSVGDHALYAGLRLQWLFSSAFLDLR